MMNEFKKVDKDNTQLIEFAIGYDTIMEGALPEFPLVDKPNRKGKYVAVDVAETVLDAYAKDLHEAYSIIEHNAALSNQLLNDLNSAKEAYVKTQRQIKEILESDSALIAAEGLLKTLEKQLDQLEESHSNDKEQIAALEAQVVALSKREEEIGILSDTVNGILDNLRSWGEEEGVDLGF